MTFLDELRSAGRFLRGVRPFLGTVPDVSAAVRRLERQLATPEATFAAVLKRAVFENEGSPYRTLFIWAGITYEDVADGLEKEGVERTLERLYDAGVHVRLEQFKGLQPIRRPGLHLPVSAGDFDNPLLATGYRAQTGGSTGAPRAIEVDLDLLAYESVYHALCFKAAGVQGRPLAIWHAAPPGAVGLKTALIQARLHHPPVRWFSQSSPRRAGLKYSAFTAAVRLVARKAGARIPRPEPTAAHEADRVAAWLVQTRGILVTTPSSAVRVCSSALERDLDISGSFFVLVGEPYTAAKAAVIESTQSRAVSHYAMTECGAIGIACQSPSAPDDVHLLTDKVATIQRVTPAGNRERPVRALFHTSLLPATPKIMLNVESGDIGVREDRSCGCGAVPRGFRRHLHTIRSYEKLTSEGMNFLGVELLRLVEQELPSRFGGRPTDYQLVEQEEDGLPSVRLVVRPAVGELDDSEVVQHVLEFLGRQGGGQRLMAGIWSDGRTLRVVREDPYVTPAGKIQALHTLA
jgi:hypothetical protein